MEITYCAGLILLVSDKNMTKKSWCKDGSRSINYAIFSQ